MEVQQATKPPFVFDHEQVPLLDLTGKELNLHFVDEHQPLFIPNNPLHWQAYKLQLLLERLDKQASNPKTAPSFNSKSYMQILSEYTAIMQKISQQEMHGLQPNAGGLAADGDGTPTPPVGDGATPGMGVRVSADNPLTRRRPDSV